jgi:hypothetical protein
VTQYAAGPEPPREQPRPPRRRGRDLARPRTRAEAIAYLVALIGLYGGVIAVFTLDAVGPTCSAARCPPVNPGIRWALAAVTWGFLALIVLALRFTRAYDRPLAAADGRRASARGWPLAWNYLACGLMVPAALRTLRRPVRPPP